MTTDASSQSVVAFTVVREQGRVTAVSTNLPELNHFLDLLRNSRAHNTWVSNQCLSLTVRVIRIIEIIERNQLHPIPVQAIALITGLQGQLYGKQGFVSRRTIVAFKRSYHSNLYRWWGIGCFYPGESQPKQHR